MERKKGAHLTWDDRLTIERMRGQGYSAPKIARYLGVHHSTIYDELNRGETEVLNTDLTRRKVYSPEVAEAYHQRKVKNMEKGLKIGKDHKLAKWLVEKISKGWSPAACCAEMGKTPETTFSVTLCRQTVYKYIENGDLWPLTNKKLRYKGARKRKHQRVRAARAPKGESIERRPDHVAQRQEPGHWEMDSVVGKSGTESALLVMTERKLRYELILPVPDHTSASVVAALDGLEEHYGSETFRKMFRTITVDNGSEFQDLEGLERKGPDGGKRTQLYYCHPRHPEERGSNEKQNQMIRWHIPKGTDLGKMPPERVREVQDWLNHYPRKILGWRTPAELFEEFLRTL